MTLLYIILATLAVSLISIVGILVIILSKKVLDKFLITMVALAGGGLIGGAFLHLIPESIQEIGSEPQDLEQIFLFVILGFLIFLLLEQFLNWHHHHHVHDHQEDCKHGCEPKKPMTLLILVGDGVHNLVDGLIIAASFIVNPAFGIITTITIALHEIPQEIGDFGVLVYGGYKKSKALLFNFISGLTAVIGGLIGFYFSGTSENAVLFLLPIAAGGFIYIAASDLVPELKHTKNGKAIAKNILIFILGIALILLMKLLPFAEH
ncbi:MAG: ZIP family metal transporter [Patescibacteria group bacterium]